MSSYFLISLPILLFFLILAIFLIFIFWKYKKLVIFGFCLLFLILGIFRHQIAEWQFLNDKLREYNDFPEPITLIGRVVKEPDIRENNIKLTVKVEKILWEIGSQTMEGKVLVATNRYPEYQYGDKLKIEGFLKNPSIFEDFNYRDYLKKEGIFSVIFWPKIELLAKNQGNFLLAKILEFKNKLREVIEENLSPPESSILMAMILGDKRRMSADLKEKLNITGLRHITAISGMHITILTLILMQLLISFLSKNQAFYLTLIFLILFIIMVGLPVSAIRAGIFAFLFLLAEKLGRLKSGSRAIVFAASIMLFQNPLLLKSDIGFQLSFLAIIGIIFLAPIFQNWLKKVPNDFLRLRTIMAMTFSAQIFTLPILVYNFGQFSLVAPLTNILVLGFLPFIFGFGFLFSLAGLIWQPLGWLLSFPCFFLLVFLTKVMDFFSQIPFSFLNFKISWFWLLIFYLILGYITWWLNNKYRLRFLDYL